MTELQFLKTMIEYVKYEDYTNKSELLTILRNSIITYDKTSSFTSKSWQFWENIDIRVPIPLLKEARAIKKRIDEVARQVYIESEDYDLNSITIKPKPIDLENENISEHNVVFDEIKDTIVQGIRNSKYIIWVAVAWFTDREIYNELLLRKKDGVNIRIITSSEDSNRYLLQDLIENFDTVTVPTWGENGRNRLHDKFCIIDFDYVMHGSYNWSKNARGNDETLATALDRDFVKKFLDEFISLHNQYKN